MVERERQKKMMVAALQRIINIFSLIRMCWLPSTMARWILFEQSFTADCLVKLSSNKICQFSTDVSANTDYLTMAEKWLCV